MARYQIRTPLNQVMEDVIDLLADKSWQILKAWDVFNREPQKDSFLNFQKAIHLRIAPHVKTYKLCGLSNICLDAVQNTSWGPPGHVLDASPTDLVYHLFPEKDSESFLNSLTSCAWESIRDLVKPAMAEEVYSILKTSFRTILGEFLYFNPLCGKTEFCVYSSSAPQKVWGRSRTS